MTAEFQLSKTGRNYLNILGLKTHYNEETEEYEPVYETEEPTDINKFMYTETISINGLFKVTSAGEESLTEQGSDSLTYMLSLHVEDKDDLSIAEFPSDGLYKIRHIVLPTWEWFSTLNNTDTGKELIAKYKQDEIDNENHVYVYNDSKIYLVNLLAEDGVPVLSTEYEISNILLANLSAYTGTLYYDEEYTFTTFDLQECFYRIIKELLNSLCANPCNTSDQSDLIYRRDLVWMAINVIKYLLDLGQFYEAQLTLENLEGCNGICSSSNINDGGSSCGCNS